MPRYQFYICDVFTEARFGGNQLAVLPEADGLSDRQMQQLAREFNFAETSFVFRSGGFTRRVRIFTPANELGFAGHPNIGTAFVLATTGALGPLGDGVTTVVFDEKAGPVPITIQRGDGQVRCELAAPQALSLGRTIGADRLARAVSLSADDVLATTHPPQVASVGAPFLLAELRDRSALARARANLDAIDAILADGAPGYLHLYTRSDDEFDIRARMFAPGAGIPEDPATGSANVALAAMLGHYDQQASGELRWRIGQGIEMGRPSVLHARVEKRDGAVVQACIGGSSVMVAEGTIESGDSA